MRHEKAVATAGKAGEDEEKMGLHDAHLFRLRTAHSPYLGADLSPL